MDCGCRNKRHGNDGCSIRNDSEDKKLVRGCTWCMKGCIKRGEG